MAHVILGLLLIAPQSLYDLVKNFEASVSLFYSASSGSIKRALDGLLRQGLIEVAGADAGARGRKAYRVTKAGRAEFAAWMTAEPSRGDIEVAVLPRIHFLGLLPAERRPEVLRLAVARIEQDLARLASLEAELGEVAEAPHEVARYQLSTLDYGIGAHRHALAWARRLLARETRGSRGAGEG